MWQDGRVHSGSCGKASGQFAHVCGVKDGIDVQIEDGFIQQVCRADLSCSFEGSGGEGESFVCIGS